MPGTASPTQKWEEIHIMSLTNIAVDLTGEEYQGVATGSGVGVSTPPVEEQGRPKRRRTRSSGSPEEVSKEIVTEMESEFKMAMEELRARLFPVKDAPVEGCLSRMYTCFSRLRKEYSRVIATSGRVHAVEKTLKNLVEVDWGQELGSQVSSQLQELGASLVSEVVQRSQEVLDRIQSEVDVTLRTLTAHDEERGKEVERVRQEFRECLGKVEREVERVGCMCEKGVKGNEEIRDNMNRVYAEVQVVGKRVEPLERNVVKEVRRGIEDLNPERLSEKVSERVSKVVSERVGERVTDCVNETMCDRVGMRVSESVSDRVVSVVKSVARENLVPERMEVDPTEGTDSWAKVVGKKKSRGPRVILELPKSTEAKVKREDIVRCLDPKEGEVRVRGLVRRGGSFVVECHDKEDIEKLRKNECLKGLGVIVDGEKGWRWPRVKMFDVDRMIGKNELLSSVRKRNEWVFQGMNEEECKAEFIPEFVSGGSMRVCTWVVRLSARVYKRVMRAGRLYVGLHSCRCAEDFTVRRCSTCLRYGHGARMCRSSLTCGWCGEEGHHQMRCPSAGNQERVKCANCWRAGYKDRCHPAGWAGCPVLEVEKRLMARNTTYDEA